MNAEKLEGNSEEVDGSDSVERGVGSNNHCDRGANTDGRSARDGDSGDIDCRDNSDGSEDLTEAVGRMAIMHDALYSGGSRAIQTNMALLNLPSNTIERICSNLDEDSLLRFREVSIAAKQIVDKHFSNMRNLDVTSLKFTGNEHNSQTTVTLNCSNFRHVFAWKLEFFPVLKEVELECSQDEDENLFLSAHMKYEVTKHVLECLKSVLQRSVIHGLHISQNDAQQLSVFSTFLEGTSIPQVEIFDPTTVCADSNAYLEIIKNTTPAHVLCSMNSITKDAFNGLLELADMVKSLQVRFDKTEFPDIVSMVGQILSRRCERLCFNGCNPVLQITNADTERLLQLLHHVDKIVFIYLWSKDEAMNGQVGNITVNKRALQRSTRTRIRITHIDF